MRLRGYDYSLPGYYFITICTLKMRMMFGVVQNEKMALNEFGRIVESCWLDLPNHYQCQLDEYVIMPNHIHGIIEIPGNVVGSYNVGSNFNAHVPSPVPAGLNPLVREDSNAYEKEKIHEKSKDLLRHSVTEIVRGFKTFSSSKINKINGTPGAKLWMRSFHDHVIRSVEDIERVREYIRLNPSKWKKDRKNPLVTV